MVHIEYGLYILTVKEDEQKKLIQGLEDEKTNLTRKLKLTQKMLDEQLEKIKAHVCICANNEPVEFINPIFIIPTSNNFG